MHAASIDKSPRLQRVDRFLQDGRWHSTLEIVQGCHVCAVNSIIAELRHNGRVIDCERRGDVWWYRLAVQPQMEMFA
jgi:hypothetical protein